jgi:hypothetical protein
VGAESLAEEVLYNTPGLITSLDIESVQGMPSDNSVEEAEEIATAMGIEVVIWDTVHDCPADQVVKSTEEDLAGLIPDDESGTAGEGTSLTAGSAQILAKAPAPVSLPVNPNVTMFRKAEYKDCRVVGGEVFSKGESGSWGSDDRESARVAKTEQTRKTLPFAEAFEIEKAKAKAGKAAIEAGGGSSSTTPKPTPAVTLPGRAKEYPAGDRPLQKGTLVKVTGLQYRREWNGTVGLVVGPAPLAADEGKWQVSLRRIGLESVSAGPVTCALAPRNLQVLTDDQAFGFGGHLDPSAIAEGQSWVFVTRDGQDLAAERYRSAAAAWLGDLEPIPEQRSSKRGVDVHDTETWTWSSSWESRRPRREYSSSSGSQSWRGGGGGSGWGHVSHWQSQPSRGQDWWSSGQWGAQRGGGSGWSSGGGGRQGGSQGGRYQQGGSSGSSSRRQNRPY